MLEQDLGAACGPRSSLFGTRLELRLAMLQYPLADRADRRADLVRRRGERAAPGPARGVVRRPCTVDRRDPAVGHARPPRRRASSDRAAPRRRGQDGLAELLDRFGESRIETWTDEDWEGFTLQALWRVCCDGVRDLPPFTSPPPPPIRQRDVLLEATGVDTDALVHDLLIRFCAAFLDQGIARWQLPRRDEGFLRRVLALLPPCRAGRRSDGAVAWPSSWVGSRTSGISPLDSILESLDELGVAEEEWEPFLSAPCWHCAAGPA